MAANLYNLSSATFQRRGGEVEEDEEEDKGDEVAPITIPRNSFHPPIVIFSRSCPPRK